METIERRITVVSASNSRYFLGTLVAFYSLLRNLASDFSANFIVLTGDWDAEQMECLSRVLDSAGHEYSLEFRVPDLSQFESCRKDYGGSYLAYARLLMPDLVASDQALYIDSDIVVQRDISWLVSLPWHDGYQLYAVVDPKSPIFAMDGINCASVGIPPRTPYFNSGFMWVNLKAWRNGKVTVGFQIILQRFAQEIRWWDQSVLNVAFWKNWLPLDYSWNSFVEQTHGKFHLFPFFPPRNINVHYLGPEKPWLTFSPYGYYFEEYWREIYKFIPERFVCDRTDICKPYQRFAFFGKRAVRHYGSFCKQSVIKLFS